MLLGSQLVQLLVAEVQDQVQADHHKVQEVEEQNVPLAGEVGHVSLVGELGTNTGDIAEEDQAQEGQALALGCAGLIGLHNVERPGGAKADDHDNFQNFRHKK